MLNTIAQSVGVSDVIDIIATSVLIYYVLLLIRGTRAVQILIGILVLVGLLGLATLFHLYVLGTILRWLVVGAAVTIPIVFQPDLRRALEQSGRGGLVALQSEAERSAARAEDRVIATLARTAFLLSENRHGGLIVIEQQSGLLEFCETGTFLHADLSEELLLAMFVPGSPLHDGAVVVREASIEAAGCLLPLAERRLTGQRLGTRHRAALGLSEQTDAVVVVVSEESGAIRIARAGKLSRAVDDQGRLVKMLLATTRPPRTQRRGPNDLVAHLRSRLRAPRPQGEARIPADVSR